MVEMVREISRQTDPQAMISVFRKETGRLYGGDGSISLSRRDLSAPKYRITRSTRWSETINPWKEPHRLPLLDGGLLSELVYADEPRSLPDVRIDSSDPAHEHLGEARSLLCLPLFDQGVAPNMVVRWSARPGGFDHISLSDALLTANLFGRATNNLVVARRLEQAYAELDQEMKRVAALQRALLPASLPTIPTLDLAAAYTTAARAGGDYYDFFDHGDGRWGVLIADVSGHGAGAAVVMSMLRTYLHARHPRTDSPGATLRYANHHLCEQARRNDGTFVTAFYGVYDPRDRSMIYAGAGHHPPLLVDRRIQVRELDEAQTLPLGVDAGCGFEEAGTSLTPGDTMLLYTDGITEATSVAGEMYGRERLLSCVREDVPNAQHIIDCVEGKLHAFTGGRPQQDDQTLLAMRVRS